MTEGCGKWEDIPENNNSTSANCVCAGPEVTHEQYLVTKTTDAGTGEIYPRADQVISTTAHRVCAISAAKHE